MARLETSQRFLQLDGLRALSVMAVAWSHWRACWFPESVIPWAGFGVETFFVISGFLITGILLDNRSVATRPLVLKQFYIRRFLRIFPLFYAVILMALFLQSNSMLETLGWHVSYLSNIYFYLYGWCGQLSHFWSLAVEEQFYIFWPLLILCFPSRWLWPAMITVVAGAPFYAWFMNTNHAGAEPVTASILMPSCMSALGMGAIMAYAARNGIAMRSFKRWLLSLGLIGIAAWCGFGCLSALAPFNRLALDCVLAWLVVSVAEGFPGPVGWLLKSPPLSYLGKISYGLYVIHNFATSLWVGLIALLGSPAWSVKSHSMPLQVSIFAAITIGLASFSWFLFEKPLNNLKHKFPYPDELPSKPFNPH